MIFKITTMTNERKRAATLAYTHYLLSTEVTMTAHEGVIGTTKYKHDVKSALARAYRVLMKESNLEIQEMLNVDEEAAMHYMRRYSNMLHELIKLNPSQIGVVHEFLKMLNEKEDYVLDRLNILKCNSDEIAETHEREDAMRDLGKMDLKQIRLTMKYANSLNNIYDIADNG